MRKLLAGFLVLVFLAILSPRAIVFAKSEKRSKADHESSLEASNKIPLMVLDDSSHEWYVDRFAGNITAGPLFFQGPARQASALKRPTAIVPLPDGRVYAEIPDVGVVSISTDGQLRLIIGCGGSQPEGRIDRVVPGAPAYNPADGMIYLTGPNCVRRIVEPEHGMRRVEVVAGVPGKEGFRDGPLKDALFTEPRNLQIDSTGTIYLLDTRSRLRRIRDGRVETLNDHMSTGESVDGNLQGAKFQLREFDTNGGGFVLADDRTLYVSDFWGRKIRKIDLVRGLVATVAGVERKNERYNKHADGPGLTHASFHSGCNFVTWDSVHNALWCGGPDEVRVRWLQDGQVRTVLPAKGNRNEWHAESSQVPGDKIWASWLAVRAVDRYGRGYLVVGGGHDGIWRIYQKAPRDIQ